MANNGAFSIEEEEYLAAQRARQKKLEKRLKKRGGDDAGPVNINSLMDIMVIILVFLLKNYGDEPIKALGEDLKAPESSALLTPEDNLAVTVSRKAILVNNKKAVDIKDGGVDASQKKGGAQSLLIQPLFDEITEASKQRKREMKLLGKDYEPMATIVADQSTPFRLLTEVMYTAGQAELSQFKFAIIKADRKTFDPKYVKPTE